MRETTHPEGRTIQWGASLILHLAIGIMLMLLPQVRRLPRPVEDSVSVEVLTPKQFEAATRPAAAEKLAEPPASRPPEAAPIPGPQPEAMIRPKELLSAGALTDPRSRKAREELKSLASGDRIIQLCNIEAMEQVHRWKAEFRPEILVAYAMAGVRLSEHSVEADGGAFRSKQRWYNVKFKCEVTPDLETVERFEFLVGKEIPESEWAVHDLPVGEAQD